MIHIKNMKALKTNVLPREKKYNNYLFDSVVNMKALRLKMKGMHFSCEFESRSWRYVLDTTLYDKFCH